MDDAHDDEAAMHDDDDHGAADDDHGAADDHHGAADDHYDCDRSRHFWDHRGPYYDHDDDRSGGSSAVSSYAAIGYVAGHHGLLDGPAGRCSCAAGLHGSEHRDHGERRRPVDPRRVGAGGARSSQVAPRLTRPRALLEGERVEGCLEVSLDGCGRPNEEPLTRAAAPKIVNEAYGSAAIIENVTAQHDRALG